MCHRGPLRDIVRPNDSRRLQASLTHVNTWPSTPGQVKSLVRVAGTTRGVKIRLDSGLGEGLPGGWIGPRTRIEVRTALPQGP